jgi:FlaA1/EpsC-like NDP-sugar epimerase
MSVTEVLEVNITDLLSRDLIDPIDNLLKMAVASKVIVITGAGGSIGSEVCRQLLNHNPKKLILVDISEASLYKIDHELKFLIKNKKNIQIISIIGSVCHYNRMNDIFNSFKPDTIYHAAAYKHVTLVENNCIEGVNNNIFGTINIANVAKEHNVKNFIFVSTDKAVRPTNIMGATKRHCVIYLQAINNKLKNVERYNTKFSIVRFDNVLGSSGSVTQLFKKQIGLGGPISLTHKDVKRYFMTIPEAAQLVI